MKYIEILFKYKMIPLWILILCLTSQCHSKESNIYNVGMKKDTSITHKICSKSIIINTKRKEIEKLLKPFFKRHDFYKDTANPFYSFDIVLNDNLEISDVKVSSYSNKEIAINLINVFYKLEYEKISVNDSCKNYSVSFIIHAESEKIIYPDDNDYYNFEMPKW